MSQKLQVLIKTCENFIELSKRLFENGAIDQEEYNKVTKKKIEFLNDYKYCESMDDMVAARVKSVASKSNITPFPKGGDLNDVG